MRLLLKRIMFASFVVAVSLATIGSTQAQVVETDDQAKIDIYTRFYNNRINNETVAYQAAKEYLAKYPKDDDAYTRYLKPWVALYDKWDRKQRVPQLIYDQNNFAEGYRLGKQVLAENPNDLATLMYLGYGAYLASTADRNEYIMIEARGYSQKPNSVIVDGPAPVQYTPIRSITDDLTLHASSSVFVSFPN